jgi:hypothetical protein
VLEPIWVAQLIISPAIRAKINGQHQVTADDVRSACECVSGLFGQWEPGDATHSRRVLVEVAVRRRSRIARRGKVDKRAATRVLVVLFPVSDPMGDVYALGSAYVRK